MATQFSGGSIINTTFNGKYKCLIMQGIMNALISAGWSLQPMSQGGSSGTYGQTFGPGNISTVTLTLASPGVVNWANHGFLGGERVMFQNDVNSGATLPTGLAVGYFSYVLESFSDDGGSPNWSNWISVFWSSGGWIV